MTAAWLVVITWDDDENGNSMRQRQSLHETRKGAITRVFDVVFDISGCSPEETSVLSLVRQSVEDLDEQAEFADIDADGNVVHYALTPMKVES